MNYSWSKNDTEIDLQTSKCIQGTVLKHLKFSDVWEARRRKEEGIKKVNWKGIDNRRILVAIETTWNFRESLSS